MSYNQLSNYATTVSENDDGETVVTYHETPIVQFSTDQFTLHNDGYYTATTKKKMNQAARQFALPYSVHQDDFTWYVSIFDAEYNVVSQSRFHDGISYARNENGEWEKIK